MANKPAPSKIIIIIILIAILALGLVVMYIRSWSDANLDFGRVRGRPPEKITPDTKSLDVNNQTDIPAVTGWATVKAYGYEFMHPNYFIQDNGDHYIMAVEPRVGQEFSALVIFKPVQLDNPMEEIQGKIDDFGNSEITVSKEPQQISMPGFKSAYLMEYNVASGPTTGNNKYYLLQSPYTDKWVAIEYADNKNGDNIVKSFKFLEE